MSYAELTVDQGSTFESTIDLVSDDGAVINVAGYVFTGQIRKSYYSANATANLTLTIINAANGNVKVSISAANTANIKAGRYLYDIKMTDTSNTVTRLVEGIITITPQVTR
jgi:ribosomal protein S1